MAVIKEEVTTYKPHLISLIMTELKSLISLHFYLWQSSVFQHSQHKMHHKASSVNANNAATHTLHKCDENHYLSFSQP